ncbi:MAG: hypothetical protein AAGF12_05555 [Myxococcota bacterium]
MRIGEVDDTVRVRFEQAVNVVEGSRNAGFPDRNELVVAAAIGGLVEKDARIARSALRIFDLVPGAIPKSEATRRRVFQQRVRPFADLLERSVTLLEVDERERLAEFMATKYEERYGAAAAAWVTLPPETALGMVESWEKGAPEHVEARFRLAAGALRRTPDAPAELATAFHSRPGLGLGRAEASDAKIIEAIKQSRGPEDLKKALEHAAERKVAGALKPALAKLRRRVFEVDPDIEAHLSAIVTDENYSLLEHEIDGENPYRDRREMLQRLLDAV